MTSVTISRVTPDEELALIEGVWNGFLLSLAPWEMHRLMREGEMIAHDAFVSGDVTLDEVRLTLSD